MKVFSRILPDGRLMKGAEYGDERGQSVLWCHGTPGSRLQVTPAMAQAASELGLRLIVPDRPGYGLSDPHSSRSILDWPTDVVGLMDSLEVGQFGVVGFSLGGMYALACAHALQQRVLSVALAGSLAPNFMSPEVAAGMLPSAFQIYVVARDNPAELKQMLAPLAQAPQQFLTMLAEPMPAADRAVLARPEIAAMYLQDCAESLQGHAQGMVADFALAAGDWGFTPEHVPQAVQLWHGLDDINAPPECARYLADRLPNPRLRLLPDEGHLCLFSHGEEILRAVG